MKPVSSTPFPLFLRTPQPTAKTVTSGEPAPVFVLRPPANTPLAPSQATAPCPPQVPKRLA